MTIDARLEATVEELINRHRGALAFDFTEDQLFTAYRELHSGVSAGEAPKLLKDHRQAMAEPFPIKGWMVHYRPVGGRFQCQRIPRADQLERLIDLSNSSLRHEMSKRLYEMDGVRFEEMVIRILREQPWVKVIEGTKRSHDRGIDFELVYEEPFAGLIALGQVKRTKDVVGGPQMRDFIGSVHADDRPAVRGIYVAYGGFNGEAQRLANKNQPNIQLCDVEDVIDWLMEAEIGVKRLQAAVYRLEDAFWQEAA